MDNNDLEVNSEGTIGRGLAAGHPSGLMTLFFSEMWERFCYYGMRVLLTLYLVKSLFKGDAEASLIYGAYTGLVYAAPILGGRMADKFLGYRLAVILGGILMAIGEFLILGGTEHMMLVGMGALIIGNGYFKANISTIVGKLYKDGDPKRDSGFTIFYIGINIGALLATSVVAYIGETYGFKYGFGLAGIGMLIGILIFWTGRYKYAAAAGLEVRDEGKRKVFGPLNMVHLISLGSLLLIPLCYVLIIQNHLLDYIFLGLFVFVTTSLIRAGAKESPVWRDRMIALVIFMVINVVFWACFEQAGTSLTLFADRNVSRDVFGWVMPASMTQFFNPFFIILFGSIFSAMWVKLSSIGKNPSIPMKFALGIVQLGLGFLLTIVGVKFADGNFQVPLLTLVFLYMLHTTGELFLSPIGLSMVTKLSPKHIAGTAMGAWFLSFAIANFVGGKIATLTAAEGHGAVTEQVEGFNEKTTVKEAFAMADMKDMQLENWVSIHPDLPVNMSYKKWSDVRDWVELREGLEQNSSFSHWLEHRSMNNEISDASIWLDKAAWQDLSERYNRLKAKDKADKEASRKSGIDMDSWLYFRGDIDKGTDMSLTLSDALASHKLVVNKNGLDKYSSVFSIMGFVLLGFALLLALLSSPLNKMMHGVR